MEFDVCVIGGGLAGLLAARSLEKCGFTVCLVEKTDRLGGQLRPSTSPYGTLGRDFGFYPSTLNSESGLQGLAAIVGHDLQGRPEQIPPLTFAKGQFQEFVGFGDQAPPYAELFTAYTTDTRLVLNRTWSELTQQLMTEFGGKVLLNAWIKQFEIENGNVRAVRFDDETSVKAKAFIYSASPKDILVQLPTEHYSQRELQKLLKTQLWSGVSLDILHGTPVTESRAAHILIGTTKESLPCLGGFESHVSLGDQIVQASHWQAFFSSDAEDEEGAANALREIKRQIKRAYPESFDKVLFEKISVTEDAHGSLKLETDAQGRWPDLQNFWISRGDQQAEGGLVGTLLQNQFVTVAIKTYLTENTTEMPQPAPLA